MPSDQGDRARVTVGQPPPAGWDARNVLNHGSDPDSTWTTVNAAEAIPGVVTPLAWSILGPTTETSFRHAFRAIGALTAAEARPPADRDLRVGALHYGRFALRLDLICDWADRIPGASGEAMGHQVFGRTPARGLAGAQYRHYPRVVRRLAVPFVRYPDRVAVDCRRVEPLWQDAVRRLPTLDVAETRALLVRGAQEFHRSTVNHVTLVLGAIQPAYQLLDRACQGTGVTAQELMTGYGGHAETALLADVWECAQGRLQVDEFLVRHGYHGPLEGDLTSRVWREDPTPILKLIDAYRERGADAEPGRGEADRERLRRARGRAMLDAHGTAGRVAAAVALRVAARYLPLRGVGKATFLQALDICRAAARRLGDLMTEDGVIGNADDVFLFELDELLARDVSSIAARAAERRALYAHYVGLQLPPSWVGPAVPAATAPITERPASLTGVAASPGVVEGRVRVVTDPQESEVEPGEILVAHNTDPSWAPIMFLSQGLIAEIGGVMSHTAVVARELGIPCVVNVSDVTQMLTTGDVIELDGGTGRIRILERSAADDEAPNPPERTAWT